MKKALYAFVFGVIFAVVIIAFFPAGELSYSFSMPYTDEQEICLAWNFSGRPVMSTDPNIEKTRRFISLEFFDYPGDEARFLLYMGIMHYDYSAGDGARSGWDWITFHFFPNYDAAGVTMEVLI